MQVSMLPVGALEPEGCMKLISLGQGSTYEVLRIQWKEPDTTNRTRIHNPC